MTDDPSVVATTLDRFRQSAEALGVRVERMAGSDEAARVVAGLAGELGVGQAIVAEELRAVGPDLVAGLDAGGCRPVAPGEPATTNDQPLGVTLGRLALAETGSVLLAESMLADRGVGLLVATLVVVCPTAVLVPSLDEAAPVLRAIASRPGASYATLVTGPSRTADIERVLTVGVQGPGRLVVLFVDNPS